MKSVLGSDFGEDFLTRDFTVAGPGPDGVEGTADDVKGGFSTSIPVEEGKSPADLVALDNNPKDGVLSPKELQSITQASKKILLEHMLKPENKDIFAKEWSEWATAKLYKTSWKPGYDSRDVPDTSEALDTYTDAYGNVYFTGIKAKETRAASLPQGEAVGPYRP